VKLTLDNTMNDRDFELLSAYIDGELEPASAVILESRLTQEPDLQAHLAALQALQGQLKAAAVALEGAPVPAHITELLQTHPSDIRAVPHRLTRFSGQLRQRFAVAASLAVAAGILLAVPQWQGGHDGATDAALLTAALETLPSRATGWDVLDDGRRLRAVLSFPGQEGSWCREYILADNDGAVRGVACRDGSNGWATLIAVPQTLLPGGDEEAYRPASAGDSGDIAKFIDRHAAGDVVGAKREAGLIARSWQ
jgi:hypothetical protein